MRGCVFVEHHDSKFQERYEIAYKPAFNEAGFGVRLVDTHQGLQKEFVKNKTSPSIDIYLTEISTNSTVEIGPYVRSSYIYSHRTIVVYYDYDDDPVQEDSSVDIEIDNLVICIFKKHEDLLSIKRKIQNKLAALKPKISSEDRLSMQLTKDHVSELSEMGFLEVINGPKGEMFRLKPGLEFEVTETGAIEIREKGYG